MCMCLVNFPLLFLIIRWPIYTDPRVDPSAAKGISLLGYFGENRIKARSDGRTCRTSLSMRPITLTVGCCVNTGHRNNNDDDGWRFYWTMGLALTVLTQLAT